MEATIQRKLFVSQERVSGIPEKRADLRRSPGNFQLPGKSGKLPVNLWIALEFHSERTSRKSPGNFRGLSRSWGDSPAHSQPLAKFVSKPFADPSSEAFSPEMLGILREMWLTLTNIFLF